MKICALSFALALSVGLAHGGAIEEWVEDSDDPEAASEWLDELRERPLDLNLASVVELTQLPLIDPVTAERLVKVRSASGRFQTFSQVAELPFLQR